MSFELLEWLWTFALLPLWMLATAATIVLAIWIERMTNITLSDGLYTWSALIGLIVAAVGLIWIECATFVVLPFVDRFCRMFGYQ